MATLRAFILDQSSLPTGNTVRDHIQNPGGVGPGGSLVLFDGLEVEMECTEFEVELDVSALEVELELGQEFEVEIEKPEFEVEVC